jgi:hypothetical protein
MMETHPAVFFSYARNDDDREGGRLGTIRAALEAELSLLSGDDWHVFRDVEDIKVGQQWSKRLEAGLTGSTFFLAVITPTYLKRDACREELKRFLKKEQQLERDDLVIPLLYLNTPAISDSGLRNRDTLARAIAERQYHDWTDLRTEPLTSVEARRRLAQLAGAILEAYARGGPGSKQLATQTVTALIASQEDFSSRESTAQTREGNVQRSLEIHEDSIVDKPVQPKVVFPLPGYERAQSGSASSLNLPPRQRGKAGKIASILVVSHC